MSLCVGRGRDTGLSDACTVSLCVGRGSGLLICLVSLMVLFVIVYCTI